MTIDQEKHEQRKLGEIKKEHTRIHKMRREKEEMRIQTGQKIKMFLVLMKLFGDRLNRDMSMDGHQSQQQQRQHQHHIFGKNVVGNVLVICSVACEYLWQYTI